MTRINVVPVESLSRQHLVAEYREITRLPKNLYCLDSFCTIANVARFSSFSGKAMVIFYTSLDDYFTYYSP